MFHVRMIHPDGYCTFEYDLVTVKGTSHELELGSVDPVETKSLLGC